MGSQRQVTKRSWRLVWGSWPRTVGQHRREHGLLCRDDPTRFLVSFPLDISKGKPRIVDVISSVVHTSLKIHKETDKGKAKDAKDEKSTLLKKYVFLEDNDKGTPTLINKWQTKQVEDDKHSKDQFMSEVSCHAGMQDHSPETISYQISI